MDFILVQEGDRIFEGMLQASGLQYMEPAGRELSKSLYILYHRRWRALYDYTPRCTAIYQHMFQAPVPFRGQLVYFTPLDSDVGVFIGNIHGSGQNAAISTNVLNIMASEAPEGSIIIGGDMYVDLCSIMQNGRWKIPVSKLKVSHGSA